jgi:hypothetical protein
MAAKHRGYWVAYDLPEEPGKALHRYGAPGEDHEDMRMELQAKENRRARRARRPDRKIARTVRVWPVENGDFCSNRPRGLPRYEKVT